MPGIGGQAIPGPREGGTEVRAGTHSYRLESSWALEARGEVHAQGS